jgi:hypothetical protein
MRPRRGTSRRDHAPAATAGGTDVGNGDAASLTDAHLRMVRWMGMAFTGLQFAVYTPPTGLELPFPRSVGLLIALPLATLNIIGLIAGASWGRRFPRGWPVAQLAVDAGVVSALLWLFAFDATNALWGLLLLPMLQAALRFRLAGSVSRGRYGRGRRWRRSTPPETHGPHTPTRTCSSTSTR